MVTLVETHGTGWGEGVVTGGVVMSLSPRIRGDSDIREGVCKIYVTLLPTLLTSLCFFNLKTTVILTASMITYIYFR